MFTVGFRRIDKADTPRRRPWVLRFLNPTLPATFVEGDSNIGNDDIPTTTPPTGGVLQSFGLYIVHCLNYKN